MLITLVVLLILALIGDVILLVFSFTRRDRQRSSAFTALAACLFFYIFGYMLEIMSNTPESVMMALRVENLGIPLVAPFFLLTMIGLFQTRFLKSWMFLVSAVYGFTIFLIVVFNQYHHLYYSLVDLYFNGEFYALVLRRGPIYFLQQGITNLCMLIAYATMIVQFIHGSKTLRSQTAMIFWGSFFGFIANLANIFGLVPYSIDPTPYALSIGLIFFALTLFKYDLMDIVSFAFDSAVKNMDDAMIVLDNNWGFIYCNDTAKAIFPSLERFSVSEKVSNVKEWPDKLLAPQNTEKPFVVEDIEIRETVQRAMVYPILGKNDTRIGISIIIRDITEQKQMLEKLEEMAITDPLTNIFNRRHFITLMNQRIEMAMRHNLMLGLVLFDLDHFKLVNDNYGHIAGDNVLRTIVERVLQQLRTHDIFARYGGEEFIIMVTENEEDSLLAFADRLRATIEETTFLFNNNIVSVTASFGATIIKPRQSYEEAMMVVDDALYEAKKRGRNQIVIKRIQSKISVQS